MSDQDAKVPHADDKQNQITEFLQTPRRKRKNYVILALHQNFPRDTLIAVTDFIRSNYPHLAMSNPQSGQELSRQFNRNISLLVVNDDLEPDEEIFRLVAALKKKRHSEKIPVLFLTKTPSDLVKSYHNYLLAYQETDEYIVQQSASTQKLLGRIQDGIENQNKRRSRRYKVDIPISFYHLNRDETLQARIVDMSIHGAQIATTADCLFKEGDQMRINIPTAQYLPLTSGDFLKLSAKVRRVFIGGNCASISFEYISEDQLAKLTIFLTKLVTIDFAKKTQDLKERASQQPQG